MSGHAAARLRTINLDFRHGTSQVAAASRPSLLKQIPRTQHYRHIQPSKCLSDGSHAFNRYQAYYKANAPYSMPQSSYYDNQNKPTAALYRARQPYLIKNIGTGLVLLGFVGAVCTSNLHWGQHKRAGS